MWFSIQTKYKVSSFILKYLLFFTYFGKKTERDGLRLNTFDIYLYQHFYVLKVLDIYKIIVFLGFTESQRNFHGHLRLKLYIIYIYI